MPPGPRGRLTVAVPRHVVAEVVAARELDLDEPLAVAALGRAGDLPVNAACAGEHGHAEPDRQLS